MAKSLGRIVLLPRPVKSGESEKKIGFEKIQHSVQSIKDPSLSAYSKILNLKVGVTFTMTGVACWLFKL